MPRRRHPPDEDTGYTVGNLLGLVAAALLIVISLLVLMRMEHFVMRRDCYVQKIHACASIGGGRYTHF
jgi:hypothetical protein